MIIVFLLGLLSGFTLAWIMVILVSLRLKVSADQKVKASREDVR